MAWPGQTASLFDDGKDAQAMRTIGEVAAALAIKQHVLRYWEQQFPMLRPLKRSGGRRLYLGGKRPAAVRNSSSVLVIRLPNPHNLLGCVRVGTGRNQP